jgi:hypothetical protein
MRATPGVVLFTVLLACGKSEESSTQDPGNGPTGIYKDSLGRNFSGHWAVKPGKEIRHTVANPLMNLSFDTTIHFIAIHLHPFAESLELRDLTTGETLFKSHAQGPEEGIGLDQVDYYASKEGIPVYKNHDYELVSVYNNTTGVDQDAMATMFFYMLDKEFQKPASLQN